MWPKMLFSWPKMLFSQKSDLAKVSLPLHRLVILRESEIPAKRCLLSTGRIDTTLSPIFRAPVYLSIVVHQPPTIGAVGPSLRFARSAPAPLSLNGG